MTTDFDEEWSDRTMRFMLSELAWLNVWNEVVVAWFYEDARVQSLSRARRRAVSYTLSSHGVAVTKVMCEIIEKKYADFVRWRDADEERSEVCGSSS